MNVNWSNKLSLPSKDVVQDQIVPITNLMYLTWRERDDLFESLDLSTCIGRQKFVTWFMNSGMQEIFKGLLPLKIEKLAMHVTTCGFCKSENGLGEDIRTVTLALAKEIAHIDSLEFQYSHASNNDQSINQFITSLPSSGNINIFNLPTSVLSRILVDHGPHIFWDKYNIGFSPWELPNPPSDYKLNEHLLNEIWAISDFVKRSYETIAEIPIIKMPLIVKAPTFKTLDRDFFSIPNNKFIFLSMFDFHSFIERKNPSAAIKSFQEAFPDSNDVCLVIKASHVNIDSEDWKNLISLTQKDSRIIVLKNNLSKSEVFSLMNLTDAFVSLHRSEGFGRCIAEMMLLNKPVLVTNFSGNCDFTHENNSYLADFELVKAKIFSIDSLWAEPSIQHAALLMKELYNDKKGREEKALQGQQYIKKHYSERSAGEMYSARLKYIFNNITI